MNTRFLATVCLLFLVGTPQILAGKWSFFGLGHHSDPSPQEHLEPMAKKIEPAAIDALQLNGSKPACTPYFVQTDTDFSEPDDPLPSYFRHHCQVHNMTDHTWIAVDDIDWSDPETADEVYYWPWACNDDGTISYYYPSNCTWSNANMNTYMTGNSNAWSENMNKDWAKRKEDGGDWWVEEEIVEEFVEAVEPEPSHCYMERVLVLKKPIKVPAQGKTKVKSAK